MGRNANPVKRIHKNLPKKFHAWLRKLWGKAPADLLKEIVYWVGFNKYHQDPTERKFHFRDGLTRFYLTQVEFGEEIGCSEDTVGRALKKLTSWNIVEATAKYNKLKIDKTLWYGLVLEDFWMKLCDLKTFAEQKAFFLSTNPQNAVSNPQIAVANPQIAEAIPDQTSDQTTDQTPKNFKKENFENSDLALRVVKEKELVQNELAKASNFNEVPFCDSIQPSTTNAFADERNDDICAVEKAVRRTRPKPTVTNRNECAVKEATQIINSMYFSLFYTIKDSKGRLPFFPWDAIAGHARSYVDDFGLETIRAAGKMFIENGWTANCLAAPDDLRRLLVQLRDGVSITFVPLGYTAPTNAPAQTESKAVNIYDIDFDSERRENSPPSDGPPEQDFQAPSTWTGHHDALSPLPAIRAELNKFSACFAGLNQNPLFALTDSMSRIEDSLAPLRKPLLNFPNLNLMGSVGSAAPP